MERLMTIVSKYRKTKIESEEEHEAIVNIIDTICSTLMTKEIISYFVELQGLELVINLFEKQSTLKRHFIKIIDFALNF
jgi:hypothetical protein